MDENSMATCLQFAKASACGMSAGCVEVAFHTASKSAGAGMCVEVGNADGQSGCDQVHVRNSRFPEREVTVPHGLWKLLVAGAQAIGQVRLTDWFPVKHYGDFAESFTTGEADAFQDGVLQNEPQLTGNR